MTRQVVMTRLVIVFVLATGCGPATEQAGEDYVVTGQAVGAPTGCSPQDIAHRMVEMLDAINRGDTNVVDEYWGRSQNAPFSWYSITEIGTSDAEVSGFSAHDWDNLAAYFQQRYQQNEQMLLRSMQFNWWEPERGLVHFGPIEIVRHADDLRPGLGDSKSIAWGKGAYHCSTKTFVVLSLCMDMDERRLCG